MTAHLIALNFARQGLDRRVRDPVKLISSLVGIYSTARTTQLALMARIDGYSIARLDKLVREDRKLVRIGAMRSSGYLVARKDLPVIVAATRHSNLRSSREFVKAFMDQQGYERQAARIEELLAEGPLSTAEIRKELAPRDQKAAGAIRYVVRLMQAESRIVKAEVQGGWRSDRYRYARWADWLPGVDPFSLGEDEARAELARRYFRCYGPAAVEDFAWWAGLTPNRAVDAIERAGLRRRRDGDVGRGGSGSDPTGVRLLPVWDNVLMSHRDRTRVVPDRLSPFVYDRSGNGTSVVVVDGRVGGVWDLVAEKSRIVIKVGPLAKFLPATWRAVEEEGERLAELLGASELSLMNCEAPDLRDGGWNLFSSPLRGCT